MKAREFAVFYADCTPQEKALVLAAANLRRWKQWYAGGRASDPATKREGVARLRQHCAALCVKLGLPENAANGTKTALYAAIANLHPERNRPDETH